MHKANKLSSPVASKYDMIEQDVLWVLNHYGSDAEKESQAKRITEFVRQLDLASDLLEKCELTLVSVSIGTR